MKTLGRCICLLMIVLITAQCTNNHTMIYSTFSNKANISDSLYFSSVNELRFKCALRTIVGYSSEQQKPNKFDQILSFTSGVSDLYINYFTCRSNDSISISSGNSGFLDSIFLGTVLGNIFGNETTLKDFLCQDSVFVYSNFSRTIFEVVSFELAVSYSLNKNINFKNQGCVIPNWQKRKLSRLKDINRIFIQEVKAKHINGDSFSSEIIRFPTKIYKIVDEKNR